MIEISRRQMLRPQPVIGFIRGKRRYRRGKPAQQNHACDCAHEESRRALGEKIHFTRHTKRVDME